ncbi:CCC motif membrane protein [Spongiivirga sp. MCCC 1A20706]|uniref:CCC motif membrane protein n=1 Tax=Spongiivirga sp. MCCC 1A20706 TaxID=3160963 RepID=UPI0039778237
MQKLPADPTALILGIVAIVFSVTGCCCSLLFILPLALSIIGLVMANKSLKEFHQNPDAYSPASKSNVNIAKVLNIIGLVLGILLMVYFIFRIAMVGSVLNDSSIWDEIQKNRDKYENYEYDDNDWEYEEDQDSIQQQRDTLVIDKIEIERVEEETEVPKN